MSAVTQLLSLLVENFKPLMAVSKTESNDLAVTGRE